ncbi:hypothetical protein [Fibrobacter sp.]|uniref:hypothetical protein n=1 Tax=Fibrobacter sp. TaxID=35828 RepID=UPI0025BC7498|nr:hypothetical protein [Fibrobacter sp.]MBR3073645.1 hypothetical protein [Fibrobacter sp.]
MNKLKILSAFAFALAFAGTSFAADEKIIGQYGAITIKKVMVERQVNGQNTQVEWKVAYIDDSSDETPVITEDIKVDSVYYSRVFKDTVSSTLMLPFDAPTWKLGEGFGVFDYIDVVKDCENCDYRINVRRHTSEMVLANTPYVVISQGKDQNISFNMVYQSPDHITLNTTTNTRKASFSSGDYNWDIIGTYERIEFKNPKGIYGFAAKDKNKTKIGQFTKAACSEKSCAYIRPFRAYLKCTLPKASAIKGLAKSADDVASLDDLPKTIDVHVIEEDSSRTYLGTLNTYTGEITVEDRWFDMKGRRLQHKPTAKGTYYNNRKKVVIK